MNVSYNFFKRLKIEIINRFKMINLRIKTGLFLDIFQVIWSKFIVNLKQIYSTEENELNLYFLFSPCTNNEINNIIQDYLNSLNSILTVSRILN